MTFPASPFGTEIDATTVVETMQSLTGWEERYRQLIQWGKLLPKMDESYKSDTVAISGCESQVWLVSKQVDGVWHFYADSDARIVRGLIALVLAAYEGKTRQQISDFDIDDYFAKTGLIAHLSPSRGNGLRAIVETIRQL